MSCLGLLINSNTDLFVVEFWYYRNILKENGEAIDFPLVFSPIVGWVVNDFDEEGGCRPVPLLANGRQLADADCDVYILYDRSTEIWQVYEFDYGVGLDSLRQFIIKQAEDQLEWELERQREKDEVPPKPGKVHHLKRPSSGKTDDDGGLS